MTDRSTARPRRGNLLADLPDARTAERFEALVETAGVRIERIVSHGQRSPEGFWYDQETAEWVVVIAGRAGLEIEGEGAILELGPGDYVELPAHCRHRLAWTSEETPTVWLAVHYGA